MYFVEKKSVSIIVFSICIYKARTHNSIYNYIPVPITAKELIKIFLWASKLLQKSHFVINYCDSNTSIITLQCMYLKSCLCY